MKKCTKKWFIFGFILFSLVLFNKQIVNAEEAILSADFSMSSGIHDEYNTVFDLPLDGSVKLNVTLKDTGTIPGLVDISIIKIDDYSSAQTVIKKITGVSSSQGIKDLNIDLSAGKYYVKSILYNEISDISETSIDVNLSISLNNLPAPENITKLNAQNIIKTSDLKDKYDKIVLGGEENELILPFTATQGGKLSFVMAYEDFTYSSMTAQVYQDKDCTKKLGKAVNIDSSTDTDNVYLDLPKKGTYYVKFKLNDDYSIYDYSTFKVQLIIYNTGDRTLTNNVVYYSYQESKSKEITYKVYAPKNGLITIDTGFFGIEDVVDISYQLYDSKKNKLSLRSTYVTDGDDAGKKYSDSKYYTVKKGTYYIKVKITSGVYAIRYTFGAKSDGAGTKKSNAKKLKVGGAAVSGYITAADKTSNIEWYTFTLKSDGNFKAVVDYKSDNIFRYDLLDSKGKLLYSVNCQEGFYISNIHSSYYMKGTYYLKVYKLDKQGSVSYNINIEH
jgi:hypothetical protein